MSDETKIPEGFIKLGVVGVDSGQLVITDPCYIGSCWTHDNPNIPLFTDTVTHPDGVKEEVKRCSPRWSNLIAQINSKELKLTTKYNVQNPFCYSACCNASESGDHQLNFPIRASGAGVCFSSGYGDGVYAVLGRKNEEGRIVEVRIIME